MKPTLSVLSCLMLKQAEINPQLLAALVGGGAGALAGGAVQGVRKLTQSPEDEERNGSPSVLKGMLLGGLGGAGLGYGLERGLPSAPEPALPRTALAGLMAGAGPASGAGPIANQDFTGDAMAAAQQQRALGALNGAKGMASAETRLAKFMHSMGFMDKKFNTSPYRGGVDFLEQGMTRSPFRPSSSGQ